MPNSLTTRCPEAIRKALAAGFTRDFAAVVLVFGVPYALAVFVQDLVVPAVHQQHLSLVGGAGLVALGLVLAGLAAWACRSARRQARRADDLMCALAAAQADLHRLRGTIGGDLSGGVRRLVTMTRWLGRDSKELPPADVTKRHLDQLAAQVEQIDGVMERLAGRRPERARRRAQGGARTRGLQMPRSAGHLQAAPIVRRA